MEHACHLAHSAPAWSCSCDRPTAAFATVTMIALAPSKDEAYASILGLFSAQAQQITRSRCRAASGPHRCLGRAAARRCGSQPPSTRRSAGWLRRARRRCRQPLSTRVRRGRSPCRPTTSRPSAAAAAALCCNQLLGCHRLVAGTADCLASDPGHGFHPDPCDDRNRPALAPSMGGRHANSV